MSDLFRLLDYLIALGFGFYISLVWLRFLLQLVGGDFYNPFSQFVVRATRPLLHPLRRLVPSVAGMDTAALVLILLLEMLELELRVLCLTGLLMPPLPLLLTTVFVLCGMLLSFYLVALIVSALASWLVPPGQTAASRLLLQVVNPLLRPIRRVLPTAGALDFSPMVALIALQISTLVLKLAITMCAPLLQEWAQFAYGVARPVMGYLGS